MNLEQRNPKVIFISGDRILREQLAKLTRNSNNIVVAEYDLLEFSNIGQIFGVGEVNLEGGIDSKKKELNSLIREQVVLILDQAGYTAMGIQVVLDKLIEINPQITLGVIARGAHQMSGGLENGVRILTAPQVTDFRNPNENWKAIIDKLAFDLDSAKKTQNDKKTEEAKSRYEAALDQANQKTSEIITKFQRHRKLAIVEIIAFVHKSLNGE